MARSSHQQVTYSEVILYTEVGVPLKQAKLEVIGKTIDYIPDNHKKYYLDVLNKSIAASFIPAQD